MFDGVGRADIKHKANAFFWPDQLFFCFPLFYLFLPPFGWLCAVDVISLFSSLAMLTALNNNRNNITASTDTAEVGVHLCHLLL